MHCRIALFLTHFDSQALLKSSKVLEAKNLANQHKHGVSFEDVSEIFRGPLFVSLKDQIEDAEQRWQTYGKVGDSLHMMAAHTVCEEDQYGLTIEVIRIISVRYATRKERQHYEFENR
jgi:uncharacterized DUF497 family protein